MTVRGFICDWYKKDFLEKPTNQTKKIVHLQFLNCID